MCYYHCNRGPSRKAARQPVSGATPAASVPAPPPSRSPLLPRAPRPPRRMSPRRRRTMATVETVLGPVEGANLGFTLSHEHVLISMGNDARNYPWRYDWDATRANAVRELSEAKAGGVGTLIE